MASMAYLRADSAKLRRPAERPIDLDAPFDWDCSSRGWNCCVDKGIPLTPYDMTRVRHALRKTSQQLIDEGLVHFEWRGGLMTAAFAQVPYERNRRACVFLEELTNEDVRRIRDDDPDRFASFPPAVQRAADSTRGGSYRVAGLCAAHSGRPEACRAFPFMLRADWQETPDQSPAVEVHRCGTCSLKRKTTVRDILVDNGLEQFWRPAAAWRIVKLYLVSRGLGHTTDPSYRSLPLDLETRTELWTNCFNPDALDVVNERFPDQWQASDDLEGDDQLLRLILTTTLDRVDALVAESGIPIEDLGLIDEPPAQRPDLDALLDPSRPVLPVISVAA